LADDRRIGGDGHRTKLEHVVRLATVGPDLLGEANVEEDEEAVTVWTYFLGTYFSLHVFTWYVVLAYLYFGVIAVALKYVLPWLNLCCRNETFLLLLFDFVFGYWAAGEVLGGWCDLERIGECIQSDTADCQSFAINMFARMTQSICERLTSDYSEEQGVYIRKPGNMCTFIFRYTGHCIMTMLSSLFTYKVFF